ncbi:MAG: aldolase [Rhodospirillales bacterium]|nr:aldolase [Rhodospirillales bacterium]
MATVATANNLRLANDPERQARIDLAAAFRWAARMGLNEGASNHFTAAVPGTDNKHFLVNPHGLHFSEIRASDLLLINAKGEVLAGEYPLESSAHHIHVPVHLARPDAMCVLHAHMPHATALSALDDSTIIPVHQNSLRFHNKVAYYDTYGGVAIADAEGERMAKALGDKWVLMLKNHGVLVTGPTIGLAFNDLYYLERAAQVQVLAMATGKKIKPIPEPEATRTAIQYDKEKDLYANVHFEALKRILLREEPEYVE